MKRSLLVACLALIGLARPAAAEALVKPGDMVAIIGDSITEQKQYSVFIEDYLLMCQPVAKVREAQFGWGGETAPGFANRMANDALRFQPTVITTCFGMNDGGYSPMTPDKAQRYRQAQQSIVEQAKKAGVRAIIVGSPGCVDADKFRNPEQAQMYNKTLAELRDIAREVAQSNGVTFANVHDAMVDAMTKAKAKYGKEYHVGGGDGVHPDANGQLVMAYAFLKAIGCDGNIGKIKVNLADGKTEASDGHKVVASEKGKVELESTRYPFCFYGDPKTTGATAGIIEFMPFNEDLNRLTLVVDGVPGEKCKVTWGKASKELTKAQLTQGINLAAEFVENPFSEAFRTVDGKVREQQNFETPLVKDLITRLPTYKQLVPEEAASLENVAAAAIRKDKTLFDAAASAVVPVKHNLVIEPIN